MKRASIQAWLATAILLARAASSQEISPAVATPPSVLISPAATTPPSVPKIQFASTVYEFGKALSGSIVQHAFVFTNTGNALLVISNVTPGCGCTTATNWSKEVEPGKTGVIDLQVNTAGYNGPIIKTPSLTCNDPTQPTIGLIIRGTVWKPIDFTPTFAILNSIVGSTNPATATVHITNNTEEMITLSAPESSNPSMKAELQTVQPGKAYDLIISTLPPLMSGSVQGNITVKTSSTNVPTLNVPAMAMVQNPVVVSPPQVLWSPMPSGIVNTRVVSIQNNLPQPMSVFNATISNPAVEVAITTNVPDKLFTVTMKFPPGFELGLSNRLELTVATSNTNEPMIRVPIVPMPRPMMPMTIPPPNPQPSSQAMRPNTVTTP